MKYKGFVIKSVPEWDCRPSRKGLPEWEHFKTGKILHYDILDPMEGGNIWISAGSVQEAKADICKFLSSAGMKDNTLPSWEKLAGYDPTQFNVVDINELNKEVA